MTQALVKTKVDEGRQVRQLRAAAGLVGFRKTRHLAGMVGWRRLIVALIRDERKPRSLQRPFIYEVADAKLKYYAMVGISEDWTYSADELARMAQQPGLDVAQVWEAINFIYDLHHNPEELYRIQDEHRAWLAKNGAYQNRLIARHAESEI